MEKLIELLNEYDNGDYQVYSWRNVGNQILAKNIPLEYELDTNESELILISKDYKFIKRLVDNDKIDHKKANLFYTYYFDETWNNMDYYKAYTEYESLLMQLSIQDNPIEFLISILK